MSAIGPGDWVVFARLSRRTIGMKLFDPLLEIGSVHMVEAVIDASWFVDGIGALELVGQYGLLPDGRRDCWDVRCFDLLYRPKAEFIESLMQPAPELETA